MKQKKPKIFDNNPHSICEWIDNCRDCHMYGRCLRKKRIEDGKLLSEIHRLKKQRMKRFLQKNILALFICTVILMIFFMIINSSESIDNKEKAPTITTTSKNNVEFIIPETELPDTDVPKVDVSVIETPDIGEVGTVKAQLSAYGPSDTYYYDISEEDKLLMAKVVWAEARGEPFEGKVAVAAVILNRYCFKENKWDFDNDSISSVIFQKNQFASIGKVTLKDLERYPDCLKAVEDACKGWDPTRKVFEKGALYFYSPTLVKGKQKEIREGIKFLAIGDHNFHYDFKKIVE